MGLEGLHEARAVELLQAREADAHRTVRTGEPHPPEPLPVEREVGARAHVEQGVAVAVGHHGAHHLLVGGARGDLRLQTLGHEQGQKVFAAQRQVEEDHRLVHDVGHRDGGLLRQRVPLRNQDVRRQVDERGEVDVVRHMQVVGQHDLGLGAAQADDELFLVALDVADLRGREGGGEGVGEFGHEHRRERHHAAEGEGSPDLSPRLGRQGVEPLGLLHEGLGFAQHLAADRRQREPLRVVTDEELHGEFPLQMRDGRRDRGLRDVDALGSERDAAGLAGGDEVFELAQGEPHSLPSASGRPDLDAASRPVLDHRSPGTP